MKVLIKQYWAAIIWALFILFATIANTQTLDKLELSELFKHDKIIHLILFGTQTWLLVYGRTQSIYKSYKNVVIVCAVISSFYGLLTEVLQGVLTSSRTFDYYDWAADSVGCLLVVVLKLTIKKVESR
jgi:VanZ family protein